MASYREPTFQERTALAAQARLKALEKLRAKPPVDEAVLAERRAAREAKEAAEAAKREAKRAAELAAKQAAEAEAAARAAAKLASQKTPEQLKAERDQRYAARKSRK